MQDAIKAREDRERRILEAQSYSNEILPRARGEAAARRQDAEAYRAQVVANAEGESDRFSQILAQYQKAPAVTRERMYLETVEAVLANSTKVLVDTRSGNNLLYLPLDQLMQRPAARGAKARRASRRRPRPPARARASANARAGKEPVAREPTLEPTVDRHRAGRDPGPHVGVHRRPARLRGRSSSSARSSSPTTSPACTSRFRSCRVVARTRSASSIYEHPEEKFLTGEKKNLIVDYFVTWRIVDPAQYYRAVTAATRRGRRAALRHHQGRHQGRDQPAHRAEVVSAERSELMAEMPAARSARARARHPGRRRARQAYRPGGRGQ